MLLFVANGGVVAVVYSIAVWSLVALSPQTFPADVVAAYAIGAICNYTGARLIFTTKTTPRTHLPRYLGVIAGTFLLTAAIAWFLGHLGAPRIISAYAPVIVTAVPSFLIMRSWVFLDDWCGRPVS